MAQSIPSRLSGLRLVSLALAACCWLAAAASAYAQLPPAQYQYVDTRLRCVRCHETQGSEDNFCKSIPAQVWTRDDKHQNAFANLHNTPERQALVRSILGFDLREAFVDDQYARLKDTGADEKVKQQIATVKACIRCHGTWPLEADARYPQAPPVPLALGVSCQACHGPGARWDLPHGTPDWRCVTPAAKEALGFFDVRTTHVKAKLCASCHVGSVAEEKFVKHEWYAAGHPPLPSFELASFEAQMPVHWASLREKGAFTYRDSAGTLADRVAALAPAGIPADAIRNGYREANFPDAAAKGLDPFSDLPRTKDALIAGIVVLETYVGSVGEYAERAAANKAPWPELALYDCGACHHELRSGLGLGLRPKRRHAPGRPPLASWPTLLAQLGARQAPREGAAADPWKDALNQFLALEQATTAYPFGNPATMRDKAAPLVATLQQLSAAAVQTRFDKGAAERARDFLVDHGSKETYDFFTARQAAWAIREMSHDLGSPAASTLFKRGSQDVLALELPSGPGRSVLDNLGLWLAAASNYDPAWFRQELEALRAKLPK